MKSEPMVKCLWSQVTVKGKGKATTVYDATLVGADSNCDIAVLKVRGP